MTSSNPYETPQASLETSSTINAYDETSPFSPKGRFGRATYIVYSFGYSLLIMIVAMIVISVVSVMAGNNSAIVSIVMGLMYVVLLPLSFIFMIRRLHDLDWSGWLSLLTIIPLINLAIAIPMLFFRGTEGANKYGPPRRPVPSHKFIAIALILVPFVGGIVAAIAIPAYQQYAQRAQQQIQAPK